MAVSNKESVIRVLHVDDDSSYLEISKLILMDIGGFEIDSASCVDEAFKKLSTERYDIVVSDYEMPQKDGLQFLKELRENCNQTPFVLFTGKGREEVAIKALNLGADGYYNKQGNPETVYGELSHGIKLSVERMKAAKSVLLNEMRLQCDLGINKMLDASEKELIDYALEAILKITQSEFAFIDLLDQNEKVMTIYSWSKNAMKECKVQINPIHCPVSEAGIWAEPIRQRKSVNIDDYSFRIHHKKGCPEGHVKIKRFLGVPVFEKEHIVAIAAVANKEECYNETDVGHITSLITDMWRLIQRKKTEASLNEAKDQLELQIKRMPIGCIVWDNQFKVTSWNPAAEKIFGYSEKEIVGKHAYDTIVPKEAQPIVERIWNRLLSGDETAHSTNDNFTKTGELITCSWTNTPLKRKDNSVIGILSMVQDITERKKAEDSLKESEEKFRNLAEESPNMIFINQKGKVFFANKKCEETIGYAQEEFYSPTFNFLSIIAPESVELLKSSFALHMRGENVPSYQYSLINKEGKKIDAIINTKLIEYNGEPAILGMVTDITEREKAKRDLQESEERFRSLFEKAPLPVAITALNGTIFDANISMQQFIGSSLEELKKSSALLLYENPHDRETLFEILKQNDVVTDFPTRLKRKDGTCLDVILNVSKFQIGKESFLRTTVQDVTERKKAEETLNDVMNQLILVNEKLGVVGSLTRHDVRNKLSAITGYAYLLKKKHSDQIDIVDGLSKMEQAVKDSMEIFDFAKMYEQLGVEELSYVSVEKALDQAVAFFSGLNIKVVNDCHGLNVLSDSLLRQLLYNFIDNTRKYGKKTTVIRVHYQLANSSELQLIYEDDGVGISAENKSKLFSEGFSTGGSTGYGLFLIRKMMEIYDWKIEENGEPGKGAKFTVTIPKLNKKGKENYQIVP